MSYQREYPANQFTGNVHLNYQYYYPSDLDADVYNIVTDGLEFEFLPFHKFFDACLNQSALYKARNKKHCAAVDRYGSTKKVSANKVARRVFC